MLRRRSRRDFCLSFGLFALSALANLALAEQNEGSNQTTAKSFNLSHGKVAVMESYSSDSLLCQEGTLVRIENGEITTKYACLPRSEECFDEQQCASCCTDLGGILQKAQCMPSLDFCSSELPEGARCSHDINCQSLRCNEQDICSNHDYSNQNGGGVLRRKIKLS